LIIHDSDHAGRETIRACLPHCLTGDTDGDGPNLLAKHWETRKAATDSRLLEMAF